MKKQKYKYFPSNVSNKYKSATTVLLKNSSNLQVKLLRRARIFAENRNGFGMNEVLGIVLAIIVAAFVIIPGLRGFAEGVITNLTNWWNITAKIIFTNN